MEGSKHSGCSRSGSRPATPRDRRICEDVVKNVARLKDEAGKECIPYVNSLRLNFTSAVCQRMWASGRVNTLDASAALAVETRRNGPVKFGSDDQHGPFGRV